MVVLFHGRLCFDSSGWPEWCARIFTAWGKEQGRNLTVAGMWQYWPCFEALSENQAVYASKGGAEIVFVNK